MGGTVVKERKGPVVVGTGRSVDTVMVTGALTRVGMDVSCVTGRLVTMVVGRRWTAEVV